jgi:DNA-binding LacI/PurR family transcriptional regulator
LEQGYRRIALLSLADAEHPIVLERERGFYRALAAQQISSNPHYHVCGDWTFESGYTQARHLLTLPTPPSAIFALNELMAAGCLQAAHELGLHVPRDVAVVTTEDSIDSIWVNYVRPRLTAVHVPMYEVARRATEILLHQLSHPTSPIQHETLPTTFTVRESSGRGSGTEAVTRGT